MSRWRTILVWTLVVIATLVTLVGSLTVWSKRQLLDTDNWTSSSGKLLTNDEIRGALSQRLVDLLFQRVDVTAALQQKLPKQAQAAAPAVAGALQTASTRAADSLLATRGAQTVWEEINRRAHSRLVAILEEKNTAPGPLETSGGDVVLDLRPLIDRLGNRLNIGDKLKQGQSPTTGEIVLVHSDQLDNAKKAVKLIKHLSTLVVIVALVLYALAIGLATGRRRTFLMVTGGSLVLVGLLLVIIRRVVGNLLIDSIVKTDVNKPAGHAVWLITTDLLRDIAIALLVYGLLLLAAGFVAGPSRPAVWLRRTLAPSFRHRPVLVYACVVAVFLIVIAWGPTDTSRRLLGIVILGALALFGLELLRRQTLREFPEGPAATPTTAPQRPVAQEASPPGGKQE